MTLLDARVLNLIRLPRRRGGAFWSTTRPGPCACRTGHLYCARAGCLCPMHAGRRR